MPVVRSVAMEHRGDQGRTHLRVILEDEGGIGSVTDRLAKRGARVLSLTRLEPSLEDAFLNLVGHGLSTGNSENGVH
jgi:ABC-2 type transport system ATP-binding protein